MKARWSTTALFELDDILRYISERDRTAAKSVAKRIEGLIAQIERFPYSGRFADEPDAWALPVVRYPYILFYAIDLAADEIVILHVRHTAQKPAPAND